MERDWVLDNPAEFHNLFMYNHNSRILYYVNLQIPFISLVTLPILTAKQHMKLTRKNII